MAAWPKLCLPENVRRDCGYLAAKDDANPAIPSKPLRCQLWKKYDEKKVRNI